MSTEHFIAGKDALPGGESPLTNPPPLHPGAQSRVFGCGAPPRAGIALERALDAPAGFSEPGLDRPVDRTHAAGRDERFFGIAAPGRQPEAGAMRRGLLAAYAKLHPPTA